LILIALLIQLAIFPTGWFEPPIKSNQEYWHLASYACLLAFALYNGRERAMWSMALGLFCNVLVISVNQGYMPVSVGALETTGAYSAVQAIQKTGVHGNVIAICPEPGLVETCRVTHLNFLGDIFILPSWIPLAKPFSIGDALLGFGLIFFLQLKMQPSKSMAKPATPSV
jgi:hypothetical protein